MADDIGRDTPRRRRIGWYLAPAVAVTVTVGAVAILVVRDRYQNSSPFNVGTCFQVVDDTGIVTAGGLRELTGRAKVVGCETAHDAEITRTAPHASDCAADGAWLNSLGQIYCVSLETP